MSYSFNEQLAKDIAEIRGEEANPADYLPEDALEAFRFLRSGFVPWDDESTSGD